MNTQVSMSMRDYIDAQPHPVVYKDEQSIFQYVNTAYCRLNGLRQSLDIIGGTAYDLPCGAAAAAEMFEEQDRHVMSTGKELKILNIHPFANGEWGVQLNTKKPWFDENKNIGGLLCHGIDITDAYTMAVSTQLAKFTGQQQNSYAIASDGGAASLSPRESEVLFLILRGKTAKLAATVLGLSYRTVQHHIESLKTKLGVDSKIDLIDAAIARGYMSQIPISMFTKQLSIVLAME